MIHLIMEIDFSFHYLVYAPLVNTMKINAPNKVKKNNIPELTL